MMNKNQRPKTNDQWSMTKALRPKTNDINYRSLVIGRWSLVFFLVSCVLCLVPFSAFAQKAEDIRDIRPPVAYPFNWTFWLILLGILALCAVIFFLWRRRKRPPRPVNVPPPLPPWEIARQALNALRQKKYSEQGKIKPYYFELSYILRCYIEARFALNAPEMTTEEFLDSLRTSRALTDQQKSTLGEFLTSCDMVKFAKYAATIGEMDKSFELVEKFVEETKIPNSA